MSNEIKGVGNSYTAEFWEYDPRLGRRWNLDPRPNVSISPYAAFANNPIFYMDPLGDTIINGQKYEPTSMDNATWMEGVVVTGKKMSRQPNFEVDYSARINGDLKQLGVHPDQLREKMAKYLPGDNDGIDLKMIEKRLKKTEYGKAFSPLVSMAFNIPKGSNADIPMPPQLSALMNAPIRYFNQQMEEGDITGIKVAHNAGYSTLLTHIGSYNKRFARPEFGGGFVVLYISRADLIMMLSNKVVASAHLLKITSTGIIDQSSREPYPYMLYFKESQLANPFIDIRNIGSIFTNLKR